MTLSRLAINAGTFCFVSGVVLAQGHAETGQSPEAEATWQRHYDAIKKELDELGDHPWAGSYYCGDGLGANLSITLAPDRGFAYQWQGCLGVYGSDYGDVAQTESGILRCYPKHSRVGSGLAEKDLLPVSWGQRRYLIPINYVAGFCDSAKSNREPRHAMQGAFYLRQGDHERPVSGAPVLPEQFHETCEDLVNRSSPNDALMGFLAAFEKLEWDRFRSYFAPDACVIHPSPETPSRTCGKAEVEASFQNVFEQVRRSSSGPIFMELRPERLNIQMLGSDAAVTSFELVNKERFGRRTIVWQKQRTGAWKVVHLHASNMQNND